MLRLLPLLCLALVACSQDTSDLEIYIDEVKRRPAKPLAPIPEIVPYVPATYEAIDLRDPFVPNEIFNPEVSEPQVAAKEGPRPIAGRDKEPLEAFPLDSLRMVGSIEIAGIRYALVRSGEPLIYRIRAGEYMGQNHGQVQRIERDRLLLKELFPDGAGRWVERETEMTLSEAAVPAKRR